jgi:Uncharacterized conserved protein
MINAKPVNDRQRLIINRMLDDEFEGFMSTSKYAKLAKCSTDTALRDIQELKERSIFVQNRGGGRSTSYRLPDREEWCASSEGKAGFEPKDGKTPLISQCHEMLRCYLQKPTTTPWECQVTSVFPRKTQCRLRNSKHASYSPGWFFRKKLLLSFQVSSRIPFTECVVLHMLEDTGCTR